MPFLDSNITTKQVMEVLVDLVAFPWVVWWVAVVWTKIEM